MMMKQRIRDALTILEAKWPDNKLSQETKERIAGIMVDYAIQCELMILRERDAESPG